MVVLIIGTSACPNSYFYCANVGHIPSYIKSFQVNDGVCDEACCDGSDENGDLIKCPNRCQEVGKAYRELQSHLKRSTEAGLLAKQKLINQAESQVAAWEEQQSILEDEIILKKSSLLQLERELKALESSSENNKKKKKSCQSGAMEVATLKHDIVILKKELNVLKTILGDMKRDHNHNFHDMAVKSAISGYDEFVTRWASLEPSIDDNLEHIDIQEPETVEEEEEQEEEEEEDIPENEGTMFMSLLRISTNYSAI
jgi:protein kinase C substrate 80K-H